MKPVLFTLAALLVLPLTAQEDEQPFFSVGSSNTFTSKQKPSFQVSAWDVESLEFRLYRVQDPTRFFSELSDLHQFGGREPAPPRKLTALEQFHYWKDEWRSEYRSLLREQFDSQAHSRVSHMLDQQRESQAARRITHFTPLPLLNPQQVVAVWKQYMPKRGGWSYEQIHFDNPGKGVFLLEAADKDLRAYTIVIVTDLAMITKQGAGHLLTYVADRESGAPVANAAISVVAQKQPVARLTSDASGLASSPLVLEHPENMLVLAKHENDWAVESPYGFNFGEMQANPWRGYIYTDRPVYRPGHPVNFKAIFRKELGLTYAIPQGDIDFQVHDPEGKIVYEKKAVSISQFGSAWGQFNLKADAALGYYSVAARTQNVQQMVGGFHVEEYKKPEYEVRVTPEKKRVFAGDPIRATIEARYYFGEPVAKGKVKWVVHRSPYYSPVFWRDDEDETSQLAADADLNADQNDADQGGDQLEEQSGILGPDGKLTINVPTALGKTDFTYSIEARVTDESNREIAGSAHAIAARGNFIVNVEPDRYGYSPGQQANFKIQARDYDGKPVATPMHLELIEWNWRDSKTRKIVGGADGTTDASTGDGTISLKIPQATSLIARVTAKTPVGREVDASTYLWIASDNSEGFTNGADIQILPDQKDLQARGHGKAPGREPIENGSHVGHRGRRQHRLAARDAPRREVVHHRDSREERVRAELLCRRDRDDRGQRASGVEEHLRAGHREAVDSPNSTRESAVQARRCRAVFGDHARHKGQPGVRRIKSGRSG